MDGNSINSNTINSEDEAIRILKNIEKLQTMEKELYKELESGTGADTSSTVTWTKIGQQHSYVTVPPNTRVRYGIPGKWIESVKSGGFIANNSTLGGDPAYGLDKNVESASTSTNNNKINSMKLKIIKCAWCKLTLIMENNIKLKRV